MSRTNLAYDEYYLNEEFVEKVKNKKKKKRSLSKKEFFVVKLVALYFSIFLFSGIFYLNGIIEKTRYNIELKELKDKISKLDNEYNQLKCDFDLRLNYHSVGEYSKSKLGMVLTNEIKYFELKD